MNLSALAAPTGITVHQAIVVSYSPTTIGISHQTVFLLYVDTAGHVAHCSPSSLKNASEKIESPETAQST